MSLYCRIQLLPLLMMLLPMLPLQPRGCCCCCHAAAAYGATFPALLLAFLLLYCSAEVAAVAVVFVFLMMYCLCLLNRDLKMENVMLDEKQRNIKLIGNYYHKSNNRQRRTPCWHSHASGVIYNVVVNVVDDLLSLVVRMLTSLSLSMGW